MTANLSWIDYIQMMLSHMERSIIFGWKCSGVMLLAMFVFKNSVYYETRRAADEYVGIIRTYRSCSEGTGRTIAVPAAASRASSKKSRNSQADSGRGGSKKKFF